MMISDVHIDDLFDDSIDYSIDDLCYIIVVAKNCVKWLCKVIDDDV